MNVYVEVLTLRADLDGRWSYRRATAVPARGESPDEAARRTAGAVPGVMHSTSWRYRPEGRVVLTYAVCPDPEPGLPATPLRTLEIARGPAPDSPTPERIEVDHVAAHAVQHLAFLMTTDQVVREALMEWPEIALALDAGELDFMST